MKKKLVLIIVIIILLLVVAAAVYFWLAASSVNQDGKYQAVFLDNGQVYFGQVSSLGGEYLKLKNIYYLQLQQPLQDQKDGASEAATEPDLTLIKLGNELHGPMDDMQINQEHVLFIEKLAASSKVVQAIMKYQAGK